VFLAVGGIAAGVSFTQVAMRLPYLTSRFTLSVLIVVVAATIIGLVALLFNMTLPVPSAPPDVMYKPPVSGG
jgi:formate-dependent nitrite reductase membrane component NrfD